MNCVTEQDGLVTKCDRIITALTYVKLERTEKDKVSHRCHDSKRGYLEEGMQWGEEGGRRG